MPTTSREKESGDRSPHSKAAGRRSDRYAMRRQKLASRLRQENVPALLVSNVTNVAYLTGFTGDSSWLLVGHGQPILISDTRYETQIAEECPGLEAVIRTNVQTLEEMLAAVAARLKLHQIGIEADSLTVAQLGSLEKKCELVDFLPTSSLVEDLRQIKDAHEIAEIREAVRLAERGFGVLTASLLAGATEREVAHDLEHTVRRLGGSGLSFPPIVAVGPRAALPHARPGTGPVGGAEFVLVDWGAESPGGYKSDLTRVVVTGKIRPKLERLYRLVFTAQQRGIEAVRPGALCKQVDAAARCVIEDAGHGQHFGHGLGHGIGLNIHEAPRLKPDADTELRPGMVVTIEPGVYLPGWGGIRIEDDVLVTRDGCEVLTSLPKELEELVVAI
ncbi:MAG TPA: Xaa-Pro peptidase family protein [Planctomycetaceae bacterium]|nr:Xaa-Pro peptidase family protein [Planctomycetaceae bacterium]